jgi:hypothetical protein
LDSEWQQLLAAMTARNPQDRPSTPEVTRALYDQTVNGRGKHKVDTAVIPGNQDARMEAVHRYGIHPPVPER